MRNEFLPGGRSCVLVVEDDPAIRLLAVDILSDVGFETMEAGDAAQALEALNILNTRSMYCSRTCECRGNERIGAGACCQT